ncbi:hypothetical protein Tco_0013413 [Tanacetum coccineum]
MDKTRVIEDVSLLTQKHLFITTTTDKHGVPPTKRLFKVVMLDPSPNLLVHGERFEIRDYLGCFAPDSKINLHQYKISKGKSQSVATRIGAGIMSMTKEQQQALDDALVPRERRLTIGRVMGYNYLSKASHKIQDEQKSYSFDMKSFRKKLFICPKLPGQKFVDPPFEEEILTYIRELGYPGNMKLLSNVKVDTLPQPWRTFGTIINKYLSGKVTRIDTLRLSRAQILWGLYHQEKVDYVYLLWEDLVFQIENKESRKNKYMFYLRFTKVIINYFMSQDQSIPRRNKVDWHMANDDPILTTMRFIPQHEVVQRYGAILPDYLTNPAMKESEAYKIYHDLATRKVQPKPKYVCRYSRTKTDEAPKPSFGKRVKTTAKVANGSGVHEGTGVSPGVPNAPTCQSDDEEISWKSSDEDDDNEVNMSEHEDDDDDERTESDNDGDEFVHPKFLTHDDEAKQDEEDSFDPRVQTPSHVESTDDEDSDDVIQDAKHAKWLAIISDSNSAFILKASISKRKLDLSWKFILGHGLLYDHAKALLEPSSTSDTLRLSRAQILWGLYHQEKVDYVYLLWEDLVFQIENKETKTNEAPKPSSGERVKVTAKVAKSGKKKQPALGLETLSDIALTKAEQMKLAIERSKTQLYLSQPCGSGAHKGTGVTPGVLGVSTYESDDEQISWKSSEKEDDDEENVSEHDDDDDDERTKSDNDGEDFVHPKFSTHDDEARQEKVNEVDSFNPRVQTPSHVESTDDDNSDK